MFRIGQDRVWGFRIRMYTMNIPYIYIYPPYIYIRIPSWMEEAAWYFRLAV